MLNSMTVCPTLNLLLKALNSVIVEAQGEQQVVYIQTIHAADILFIKESKKPVQKCPATQVKDETMCRLGLQISPEVTEVQSWNITGLCLQYFTAHQYLNARTTFHSISGSNSSSFQTKKKRMLYT